MKLEALRAAIREFAQRRQSAWMAAFDAAIAQTSADQRAKGKLHTAASGEAFAKSAQKLLSDVGSELAAQILESIEAGGKGTLTESAVVAEFAATMKFGRDRLTSKLLKAIESLGLASASGGSEGLQRFKSVSSYEPGESKLRTYFSGNTISRGGKPLSEWKQTAPPPADATAAPTRVWFVVLVVSVGILLGSGIWLFSELYRV